MNRDRNLLFGVLAVQLKKVTASQLVDAAAAWAADQSRDLGSRLVEGGALSDEDRKFIDDVVDRAIKDHGGDAAATLSSFGGEEQVYHSFRGSIAVTESGGVKSVAVVEPQGEALDADGAPGVEESPGRYTHVGEHGRGAMGRVLLVHDEHLGRDIALKELLPVAGADDGSGQATPVRMATPVMARFLQEARITGQLDHPSIVPVYELGYRKDGTLYYTMKLVRGKTLAQAIKEAGTLEERLKLLPHFVDLCQAVAYAHSLGVIHRDIKPANVMVGEFGETVILDWGLAKAKDKVDIHADGMAKTLRAMSLGEEEGVHKTQYGQALGTPVYMPPEQAKGELDRIDERSDIYSLGAVLYEILTGHMPFEGDSLARIIHQVINEEPKPIDSLAARTPPDLIAICQRAMHKAQGERYQSAKELADAVQKSKLRPPKSRVRRFIQYAALFLLIFVPTAVTLANLKSERDLKRLFARLEADGISTSGGFFPADAGETARTDPTGAIYALEWQFPTYWDRVPRDTWDEVRAIIRRKQPHVLPLTSEETDLFRSVVAEYEDVLAAVGRIAEMPPTPASGAVKDWLTAGKHSWETRLPNLLGLRGCANLLACRAYLSCSEGDYDEALDCCTESVRFARHLHEVPILFTVMVRYALESIAISSFQGLPSGAPYSEERLAAFREALQGALKDDVATGLEGGLRSFVHFFKTLRTDPSAVVEALSSSASSASGSYSRLWHAAALLYGSWPLRFWCNADQMCSIEFHAQLILLCRKPYYASKEELARVIGDFPSTTFAQIRFPISSLFVGNLGRSRIVDAEREARLQQALIALALRDHRKTCGAYPQTLDALVPEYLEAVPPDPLTGTAFVYQSDEDGFTLYSAGDDGAVDLGPARRRTALTPKEAQEVIGKAGTEYKKRHGAWPDSLEALVPEFFNEMPRDWPRGQPFRYSVQYDKVEVARRDADGNPVPHGASYNSDDIVWIDSLRE